MTVFAGSFVFALTITMNFIVCPFLFFGLGAGLNPSSTDTVGTELFTESTPRTNFFFPRCSSVGLWAYPERTRIAQRAILVLEHPQHS